MAHKATRSEREERGGEGRTKRQDFLSRTVAVRLVALTVVYIINTIPHKGGVHPTKYNRNGRPNRVSVMGIVNACNTGTLVRKKARLPMPAENARL